MSDKGKHYNNPDYRTFRTIADLEKFCAWLEVEITKCSTPKQRTRLYQFTEGLEKAKTELDWRQNRNLFEFDESDER